MHPRAGSRRALRDPRSSMLRRASAGLGRPASPTPRRAGERLDRQRPGPAEEVKHRHPRTSPRIENNASRTRSAVGRTSRAAPAAKAQPPAPPPNSSPATTLRPPRLRRRPRRCARPRTPRGVQRRAELGRVERAVPGQHGQHLAPRAREQLAVLGQSSDPEAREAVLARAQDLALAAKREVDLGELEPVAALWRSPPSAAAPAPTPASANRMHCESCSPRPTLPRS